MDLARGMCRPRWYWRAQRRSWCWSINLRIFDLGHGEKHTINTIKKDQARYIVISYTMINGRTLWLTSDWNTAFTSEFLDSSQWPGEAMFDPYQTTFDEEVPQDAEWFMQKASWENVDNLTPDKFNELFLEGQHFYARFVDIFDKFIARIIRLPLSHLLCVCEERLGSTSWNGPFCL